jgi:hypothetical protein
MKWTWCWCCRPSGVFEGRAIWRRDEVGPIAGCMLSHIKTFVPWSPHIFVGSSTDAFRSSTVSAGGKGKASEWRSAMADV